MTVRLNDRLLTRIRDEVGRFMRGKIRVGFLDDELATIAAVHEFGSSGTSTESNRGRGAPSSDPSRSRRRGGNIPSRPFIRQGLEAERSQIARKHREVVGKLMTGRIGAKRAGQELGDFLVGVLQRSIDRSPAWAVPLKPATSAAKGSDHPLIDEGVLRAGIRVEVDI
jgi:hypothetical protein